MARYARARWRPIPENNSQTRISPRAVVLHTAVSNSASLYGFWTSTGSAGVESHFYCTKSGDLEQYLDTTRRADCQRDGNSFSISVETWDGYPHGWNNDYDVPAWTSAQFEALAQLLAWAHRTHGIPLRKSRYWNDHGIAWHNKYIGQPGFAASARECPGDKRIAQIPGLIKRAQRIVDGIPTKDWFDMATEADLKKLLDPLRERIEGLGGRIEAMRDELDVIPTRTWRVRIPHPNPDKGNAEAGTYLAHGRVDAWSAPQAMKAARACLEGVRQLILAQQPAEPEPEVRSLITEIDEVSRQLANHEPDEALTAESA